MSIVSQLEKIRASYAASPSDSDDDEDAAAKFKMAIHRALHERQGLVIAAITSRVQASFESDETPFGAGKTTLAMDLAYHYNAYDAEEDRQIYPTLEHEERSKFNFENWATVNRYLYDNPGKLLGETRLALMENRRIKVAIWDDVQATAPSESGKSRDLALLVGNIQRQRLALGVLLLTFPSKNDIASSIRRLIQYELIVYRTGKYEIQMFHRRVNFKNPERDWERMEFLSGNPGSGIEFNPLPPQEQEWYDNWRIERMVSHPVSTRHRFDVPGQAELPEKPQAKPVPEQPAKVPGRWGE